MVGDQTVRKNVGSEETKEESAGERELSEKRKRGCYGWEKRETGLIWEDVVLKAWAKTLGQQRETDPEGSAGNWHGVGNVAEESGVLSEGWSRDGTEDREHVNGLPATGGELQLHGKLLLESESESNDSGGLSNMSRSPPPQDSKRCTKASWSSRCPTKWRCPNRRALEHKYCEKHIHMERGRTCKRARPRAPLPKGSAFPQAPFVSGFDKRRACDREKSRGRGLRCPVRGGAGLE